jgi:biopolymer transport protein ExbD
MPIEAPRPRLRTHVGLTCRSRARRKPLAASLQLTPLLDVLLVVVFFLLYRFEASGEVCICPSRRITLPLAEKTGLLERAPVIEITEPEITLDGRVVATIEEVRSEGSPDWRILRMVEHLEVQRHNWGLTNPGAPFPGEVVIAADENVDMVVMKKVLYSCGLAGYEVAQLAVRTARALP